MTESIILKKFYIDGKNNDIRIENRTVFKNMACDTINKKNTKNSYNSYIFIIEKDIAT